MAYIEGHAREQALLLPASVEDYVGADGPVRFIDVFVDDLDLAEAGFVRAQPKATGRPGYHPADMLKLYLYGYLNRVRSSRRLEAEATRNLELIWLLRGLRPDYKTIADFRRDNRGAFKAVFRAFVTLCRRLDLFGRELLAVDGTRLKAVNNPERNFSSSKLARYIAAADERLEGYLAELDAIDRGEDGPGPGRREALAAKIATVRARRLGFLDEGRRWSPWQVRPGAVPGAIGRETCADLLVIAGQFFSRPIVSLRSNAPVADLADGLLGLGIIQRLDWIVGRVTASLWINPNDRKVAPQSYNRSGILVDPAADGGGILEVGAGSPTGRAGIMKGDHIVGMTTPDIEHALAGPVGKAVTLDIDRDGATKSVSFELTDFLQILSPIPANSTY